MPDQLFFDIVKMVVALACIVGLIYGVVYVLKRLAPGAVGAGRSKVELQVLAQFSLGSRQRVCVMRVQGRTLVLGVTEGSITNLAELSPQQPDAQKEADDPKIFADLLSWRKDSSAPLQGPGASGHSLNQSADQPKGAAERSNQDRGDGPSLFSPGERSTL